MAKADVRRSFTVVGGLATAVLVAGCTASDHDDPKRTGPTPTSAKNVTIVMDDSTPSLKEGRDYSIVASWPQVIDRRFVGYQASVDKRHAIAVLSDYDAVDPSVEPDPSGQRIVEVDTQTGKLRSLARQHGTANRPRDIIDVAVSGDHVVWTESESTTLELLPWDIYSLDLRSHKERHLASSRDFDVKDPPPPSPTYDQQITVVGDSVYFPAVERVTAGSIQSSIYAVSLTVETSRPRLIASSANQVFADGKGIRVMLNGKLVTWDPARGTSGKTDQVLEADCGGFFGEGVAVLCNEDPNKLSIVSRDGATTILDMSAFAQKDEPAMAGYLYANSRWVGFTVNGSQGYMFDLERKAVFKLGGVSNSPEYTVADDWLPNEQAVIHPPIPQKIEFFALTKK